MMLQMMMGGKVYETSSFKQAMDSNYYPLESMKKSVDTKKRPEHRYRNHGVRSVSADIGAPANKSERPENLAAEYGARPYPVERSTQHRAGLEGRFHRPSDKVCAVGRLRSQML